MYVEGYFHRMFTLITEMWIREEASQCAGDQTGIEPSFRLCPRVNSCQLLPKFCMSLDELREKGEVKGREKTGDEESDGFESENVG